MKEHHKLINWRQVSKLLAGNPESVRSNYRGKKYQKPVTELSEFLNKWFEKYNKKQSNGN